MSLVSRKILALLLSSLIAACSATSPVRVEEHDLTRSVLLIQELPDGRVIHLWQRAEDINLSKYRHLPVARAAVRRFVFVMGPARDCDEENRECIRKCMSRPLGRGYGHITSGGRGKGGKEEFCERECQRALDDCSELERLKPQEFTAVDDAIDWLKRNHRVILVGTVVVIAGVAFVVVSAGVGLVILAPAVLLAEPEFEHPGYIAGAVR